MVPMRIVTLRDRGGERHVGRLEGERVVLLAAADMLAWLSGAGREDSGESLAVAEVELLAPVPEPPSVRDFYSFEGHVAAGWRRRGGEVPEAWYEAPSFYFSNPASILGPEQPVEPPSGTAMLDFELEIAAVLDAAGEIAGFTLLNDWSARDIQGREMGVGLGPAKGKDFATSLGPWLASPDELPIRDGRLRLEAAVSVNGHELSRSDAGEQHFSWPQLVAHAGRDTRLRAGDVLGSGTLHGGCLLELGPLTDEDGHGERYLRSGDVVELRAEGLGTLRTPIA
jgi:fumarylacetoacetate (FAA) hydrolase